MDARPLPSLFGRFTTILRDHGHVALLLRQFDELCAAIDAGQPAPVQPQPAALAAELTADLLKHFAAEEADSYFGTIVRERPALLPQISELRAEHTWMLEELAMLESLAKDSERWPELAAPMSKLVATLRAHERAESELLREFFAE